MGTDSLFLEQENYALTLNKAIVQPFCKGRWGIGAGELPFSCIAITQITGLTLEGDSASCNTEQILSFPFALPHTPFTPTPSALHNMV